MRVADSLNPKIIYIQVTGLSNHNCHGCIHHMNDRCYEELPNRKDRYPCNWETNWVLENKEPK